MRRSHRIHTTRRPAGANLFWLGYSGLITATAQGTAVEQTLVDPRVFEPGGESSTYGKDANRPVVTILRQRLEYSLTYFEGTDGSATIADFYFGIFKGNVGVPTGANLATEAAQQCDWLDLWMDTAAAGLTTVASSKTLNGVASRDLRTKRSLQNDNRSYMILTMVMFAHTGALGVGPSASCQFQYRALCKSNN